MFTTKPETFKNLSIEERTAYSSYFKEKLSELKSTHSELTENNEINLDYKNEIANLEDTLWCLDYGFSSLYDYYGLNDITSIDPKDTPKDNSKDTLYNYVGDKLQNKIIGYLSFLEYVYTTLGNDILKARGVNALRYYFYPYICDTHGKYRSIEANQINKFVYLLIKNKFKNLNHFICLDLKDQGVYINIMSDFNVRKVSYLKQSYLKNDYLKDYFIRKEHDSTNLSGDTSKIIFITDYEETLDEYMSDILNKKRNEKNLILNDLGYEVNDFRLTARILRKHFGISSKHSNTLNL